MKWSVVRRRERGTSALEFALILTPLLLLTWGIISYGVMLSFRQNLSQAAGDAARAAVGAPTTCTTAMTAPYSGSNTCAAQYYAAQAINTSLNQYSMSCGNKNLTCVISQPTTGTLPNGTVCPAGHSCVQVTLTYPYSSNPMVPSMPGIGLVLPKSLTFTSTVEVS